MLRPRRYVAAYCGPGLAGALVAMLAPTPAVLGVGLLLLGFSGALPQVAAFKARRSGRADDGHATTQISRIVPPATALISLPPAVLGVAFGWRSAMAFVAVVFAVLIWTKLRHPQTIPPPDAPQRPARPRSRAECWTYPVRLAKALGPPPGLPADHRAWLTFGLGAGAFVVYWISLAPLLGGGRWVPALAALVGCVRLGAPVLVSGFVALTALDPCRSARVAYLTALGGCAPLVLSGLLTGLPVPARLVLAAVGMLVIEGAVAAGRNAVRIRSDQRDDAGPRALELVAAEALFAWLVGFPMGLVMAWGGVVPTILIGAALTALAALTGGGRLGRDGREPADRVEAGDVDVTVERRDSDGYALVTLSRRGAPVHCGVLVPGRTELVLADDHGRRQLRLALALPPRRPHPSAVALGGIRRSTKVAGLHIIAGGRTRLTVCPSGPTAFRLQSCPSGWVRSRHWR
jgi:hypothetical protein